MSAHIALNRNDPKSGDEKRVHAHDPVHAAIGVSCDFYLQALVGRPIFLPSEVHTCVPNDAKGHVVVVRITVAYEFNLAICFRSAVAGRTSTSFADCRNRFEKYRAETEAWSRGLPHKMDRVRLVVQSILARCCQHSSFSLTQPSGPYLATALMASGRPLRGCKHV